MDVVPTPVFSSRGNVHQNRERDHNCFVHVLCDIRAMSVIIHFWGIWEGILNDLERGPLSFFKMKFVFLVST